MIEVKDLQYAYRKGADALRGVSASFASGISLLMGENGAGKTTLLRLMAGLLRPSAGECTVDGIDVWARTPATLQSVAYLGDDNSFPAPTIARVAKIHGCFYPDFSMEMLRANLDAFGIDIDADLDNLSLGNRRKAHLAYVLALQPKVLLLDEPANGLDITSRQTLTRLLASCLGPEQTVIISTHSIHGLDPLFDAVAVLSKGRLLFNADTDTIASRLEFVQSFSEVPDALYSSWSQGVCHAVLPANPDSEYDPTKVDFEALYGAALSNPEVSEILNKDR